jgi:hypothetical protein
MNKAAVLNQRFLAATLIQGLFKRENCHVGLGGVWT